MGDGDIVKLVSAHPLMSWTVIDSLQPWVFVAALIGVLVVTVGLVTTRSFSAATRNPVESIKAE